MVRRRLLGRLAAVVAAAALVVFAVREAEDAGWFDARAVAVPEDVARAMLRDVNRWDAATSGERRGVAERVERALRAESAAGGERATGAESAAGAPPEWTLLRVRPFGFEGHRHEIAVFRHETTGLEFSLIPGGTFTMGSPATEADRNDDETQHEVTLTRPFLLARTECTQAAWERGTGRNRSRYRGPDLPVEIVSWDGATAFCAKAGLRLPTEAEWEFACRAGTTTAFWSGDAEADLARVGWYAGNADSMPPWLRWALTKVGRPPRGPQTQAVGALPANPFGLHDVHGNVWEWCADGRDTYPSGPLTDPTGHEAASIRVNRGGSWCDSAWYARSALRSWIDPGSRDVILGFRPARSVPP